MNEQAEKELKMLLDMRWDPRCGLGKMLGSLRMVLIFSIGPIIAINMMYSLYAIHLLPVLGLVACWGWPRSVRVRTKARALRHDWFLCPWCRYALTGLEDEGVCPECGSGYRKDVCVELYQSAYKGYRPDAVLFRERESKAWREAIELRDGVASGRGE